MKFNLLKILLLVAASTAFVACVKSGGGSPSSLSNASTNMGTTNTGNALQPLELVVGLSGAPPVSGADGNALSTTQELVTTGSYFYDYTIGAEYCELTNYEGLPFCVNNTCANAADPDMCYAQNACMADADMVAGTVSIASDASTNTAPTAQCTTNGYVYFLTLTLYANYDREYFVSTTPQPMSASGADINSCLGRMGYFLSSGFTDYGNMVTPADNGDGYVNFACAVDPQNSNEGSFTIEYCQNAAACGSY